MPLLHESIADIQEAELVAKVLRDSHHGQTLFNIKGILFAGAKIRKDVQLGEFGTDLKGDVDILVLPSNAPDMTTAIQVKRFSAKIGLDEARTDHPERFKKLFKKGVRQANALTAIGFSRVYLWVFYRHRYARAEQRTTHLRRSGCPAALAHPSGHFGRRLGS